MTDDFERLRLRKAGLVPHDNPMVSDTCPAFVGQVTTAAPEVGKFCLVTPTDVTGPETAGGIATLTASPGSIAVYILGPAAPIMGEYLVCRHVDYRWVAERMSSASGHGGGGGGVPLPGCFCSPIPATLSMTSFNPACNFGMFQSCTIQYGPTPSGFLGAGLGANSFLSVQSFPDVIGGGALFRYLLTCQFNQFNLSRVYLESPFGSPFRDGLLYTWLLGSSGNTCTPFALTNGVPFAGSDTTCNVAINA